MNKASEENTLQHGDAIEALLEKATPRPAPPAAVEQQIRAEVRGEWQAVAGRNRRRRQLTGFAVAASVLLAITATFGMLRQSGIAPVEVATVARSDGSIKIESARGQQSADSFTSIVTGQVLLTSAESHVGLAWHRGGSLRLDKATRVEFISESEVYLHAGRVYVDSAGMAADAPFVIRTAHGAVSHVGTQYLAKTTPASLIVSVREGKVEIDGTYHDEDAVAGQVITLTGSSSGTITNTTGTGSDWDWIEIVAPAVDMTGRKIHDFLQWVGHETGHEIRYTSEAAEQLARDEEFHGDIEGHPRSDLRLYMFTVDLEAQWEPNDPDGPSIYISLSR